MQPDRAMKEMGGQPAQSGRRCACCGHVAIYRVGSAADELMRAAKTLADRRTVFHQHQSLMVSDGYDEKRFGKPAWFTLPNRG